MKKTRSHFNLILRPEPEGGFTVIVPALPGCVTYGRNLAEAKDMAKDAIAGYIEKSQETQGAHPNRRRVSGDFSRIRVCRNFPPLNLASIMFPAVISSTVIRFLDAAP
jgi:antitoxin HicB